MIRFSLKTKDPMKARFIWEQEYGKRWSKYWISKELDEAEQSRPKIDFQWGEKYTISRFEPKDNGEVAQSVERGTENPCVDGSIPPLAIPAILDNQERG